jgi:hypothetical protein
LQIKLIFDSYIVSVSYTSSQPSSSSSSSSFSSSSSSSSLSPLGDSLLYASEKDRAYQALNSLIALSCCEENEAFLMTTSFCSLYLDLLRSCDPLMISTTVVLLLNICNEDDFTFNNSLIKLNIFVIYFNILKEFVNHPLISKVESSKPESNLSTNFPFEFTVFINILHHISILTKNNLFACKILIKLEYVMMLSQYLLVLSSSVYSTISQTSPIPTILPCDNSFTQISKAILATLSIFVNCTITSDLTFYFIENQSLLLPSLLTSFKPINLFILNEFSIFDSNKRCKVPQLLEFSVLFISKIFNNIAFAGNRSENQKKNTCNELFRTQNGIEIMFSAFEKYFEIVSDTFMFKPNLLECDISLVLLESVKHISVCIMNLFKGIKLSSFLPFGHSSSSNPSPTLNNKTLNIIAYIVGKLKEGFILKSTFKDNRTSSLSLSDNSYSTQFLISSSQQQDNIWCDIAEKAFMDPLDSENAMNEYINLKKILK